MTLRDLYIQIHGDYDDVMRRLQREDRIVRYLRMLPESEDYRQLQQHLDAHQFEDAFRDVHTIKGVALNLSLTALAERSSALCEALRNGPPTVDITDMRAQVTREYEHVIAVLANDLPGVQLGD